MEEGSPTSTAPSGSPTLPSDIYQGSDDLNTLGNSFQHHMITDMDNPSSGRSCRDNPYQIFRPGASHYHSPVGRQLPRRLTPYPSQLFLVHLHQYSTLPCSNTMESFQTHGKGVGPTQRVHQVSMLTPDQLCPS